MEVFITTPKNNAREFTKGGFYEQLTVLNEEFRTILRLKWYTTGKRNYCCAFHDQGNGGGAAGGFGYDRASAAAQTALEASGLVFSEPFAGRGRYKMEAAITAAARKLNGHNFVHLVWANE